MKLPQHFFMSPVTPLLLYVSPIMTFSLFETLATQLMFTLSVRSFRYSEEVVHSPIVMTSTETL